MSLAPLSPELLKQQRKIQSCFGGVDSFSNYQYWNFAILGTAVLATLVTGAVALPTFLAAALMAIFDLPAVLLIGSIVLVNATRSSDFQWNSITYMWLGAGVFAGHYLAAILHNTAHRNFKPVWLNRPIGEITGFMLTYGFVPFRTVHRMHHVFTDQELDPHSPRGMTMLQFMLRVRGQIFNQLRTAFFIACGDQSKATRFKWNYLQFFIVSNRVFRLSLMIALFGQTNFVLFAMPCYLVNFLVFTVFNYKMHIHDETGDVLLQNLDQTLYQKVINMTCHGVLYHKNHHTDAKHFDPRTA